MERGRLLLRQDAGNCDPQGLGSQFPAIWPQGRWGKMPTLRPKGVQLAIELATRRLPVTASWALHHDDGRHDSLQHQALPNA